MHGFSPLAPREKPSFGAFFCRGYERDRFSSSEWLNTASRSL
jgi:hypothetical protein